METTTEKVDRQFELARSLLASGVLQRLPSPPAPADDSFRRWCPIELDGKPVSETLVEERR